MSIIPFLQQIIEETKKEFLAEIKETVIATINSQKSNNKELDEYLTITETCKLIKVHKTTLWKYTKKGKLKSYYIGNKVLYKRSEVEKSLIQLSN